MNIEKVMKNLRNEIWRKIKDNNYTLSEFADICDISYENLNKILSKERKDIMTSTILKICQNSNIKIENIFDIRENKEIEIILHFDGDEYSGKLQAKKM